MVKVLRFACPPLAADCARRRTLLGLLLACCIGAGVPATAQERAALERPRYQLAQAFEHGEGVPRDQSRARALYCLEARGGNVEAAYALGWMYANGRGGERSDEIAAGMFALAAAAGHLQASNMLRVLGVEETKKPDCMRVRSARQALAGPAAWQFAHYLAQRAPWQRPHAKLIYRLAPEFGIEPGLALAIAETESDFDPAARSAKDAVGLMQLIASTAERFGVRDRTDPEQNVRGGLAYLRWLMSHFRGRVELVIAAYNAGEGAVGKYRGVPPFQETRRYVARVRALYPSNRHFFDAAVAPEASPALVERIGETAQGTPG